MAKVKRVSVGGQALIEGILMRGPKCSAVALRLPDGSIEVEEKKITSLREKYKILGLPIIRGVVSFAESMITGYKCLMESAEKVSFEEIKNTDEDPENMSKVDKWITDHFGEKMMSAISVISVILGFALAFALFFYLPREISSWIDKLTNSFLSEPVSQEYIKTLADGFAKTFLQNFSLIPIIEGTVKFIIFFAYMLIVSQMKDIKRMFMYHGAEHKSIFCFEAGKELTVENVRKMSRFHPRCGTSFMFVMIIVGVVVSSVVSFIFPELLGNEFYNKLLWILVKVLLLPITMGLGFEFIKFAGCHDNFIIRMLSAPGLWMQRITTKEPTDDIIEVGIASIKAALYGVETDNTSEEKVEETEEKAE